MLRYSFRRSTDWPDRACQPRRKKLSRSVVGRIPNPPRKHLVSYGHCTLPHVAVKRLGVYYIWCRSRRCNASRPPAGLLGCQVSIRQFPEGRPSPLTRGGTPWVKIILLIQVTWECSLRLGPRPKRVKLLADLLGPNSRSMREQTKTRVRPPGLARR